MLHMCDLLFIAAEKCDELVAAVLHALVTKHTICHGDKMIMTLGRNVSSSRADATGQQSSCWLKSRLIRPDRQGRLSRLRMW